MIDKVVRLNSQEALILYTHRAPVKLTADNIDHMLSWFFDKTTQLTYTEHTSAVTGLSEETAIIDLKVAA